MRSNALFANLERILMKLGTVPSTMEVLVGRLLTIVGFICVSHRVARIYAL